MGTREFQIRDKCTYCENGVTYSQQWKEWGEKFDAWNKAHGNMGYSHPEVDQWERDNPIPTEPEELQCIECEGTTWIYKWVDLADITRPIYDLIAGGAA